MRLRIFALFLTLFVATTAGHIYTVDGYLNYLVTEAAGERGTLEIPRFMMTVEGTGGRQFSKLGVGLSFASLPLFWLGSAIEKADPGAGVFRAYSEEFVIPGGEREITAEPQTLIRAGSREGARLFFALLTNAFFAAALCLVFWLLLRDFGLSDTGALWGTALLAFATPLWVYSRDFFSEPVFALCLVGNFYFLKDGAGAEEDAGNAGVGWRGTSAAAAKRTTMAGLLASLGILSRASFIPTIFIFAAYLGFATRDRKSGLRAAVRYLAFCVPGLAIFGALNAARFGSPFLTGYHTAFDRGFSVPLIKGLFWNLFSPYRSIFIYAPVTLLILPGVFIFAKKHLKEFLLLSAIVVYVFLVYSRWWAWHGGWCWGPRFLVPIIPLLLLPGLVAVSVKGKWLLPAAVVLGLAGFIIQLAGVLINYTAAYDFWIKIGKLDWAETDIQLFSPITTHFRSLAATSPGNYDLWLIQAYKVSPVGIVVLIAVLLAAILVALWPFLHRRQTEAGK